MTDSSTEFRGGCVHCHAPLTLTTHENVQLLTCPAGHGMFINAEALQVAVRDTTADRSEHEEQAAEQQQRSIAVEQLETDEQPRECPTCGTAMTKRVYAYESGVPIDVCDEHGVWLDQGELERIEAWYEAQVRHRDKDRAEWGGQTGKLEQIEERFERDRADQVRGAHWGPVGWFLGQGSWLRDRRDDMLR